MRVGYLMSQTPFKLGSDLKHITLRLMSTYGAFDLNTRFAGLGGVARNQSGQLVGYEGRRLTCMSAMETEALALQIGLCWAMKQGSMEEDCLGDGLKVALSSNDRGGEDHSLTSQEDYRGCILSV